MFFQSKDKADCCGCGVCSSVCEKNAITMQDDGRGFKYPVINAELCINCGLCEKSCIFMEKTGESSYENKYYAIRSRDDGVVRQSSSGGMFTLMAEEIFSRNGVVYGVAYGEDFRVAHRKAENMSEADAFRTSKYVQSSTDGLFDSVRVDLEAQRTVLVTGTPCQIAGLKKYLSHKHIDDSLLYTCDNICHGVSSPLTFSDYMSFLEKYIPEGDRIASINMRYKKKKGKKTILNVSMEKSGSLAEVDSFSYYRLFLNRIANRPSCFACRFTSYSRAGDLSVGDFWNSSGSDFSFDTSYGVNEVLVNSDKGSELMNALCKRAFYQEVSKEKAWQPHLEYATQKPKNYEVFWKEYLLSEDREQIMRKYLKVSPLFKVIISVTPMLRKLGLYTIFGKMYKSVFVKKKC